MIFKIIATYYVFWFISLFVTEMLDEGTFRDILRFNTAIGGILGVCGIVGIVLCIIWGG